MQKDIERPLVQDVAMAVIRELDEEGEEAWYVYLVNLRDETLENVLVSSRGYGEMAGEARRTSELRHFLEVLAPRSWARIERIMENVFALNNQYWLSFYLQGALYDRKYIFVAGSIEETNFTTVPLMEKRGVMIV